MNFKHILYFFGLILLLAACEEVITLDLENDAPQLVIEAVADATLGILSVQLTQSNDFYDNSLPKTIDGASIELKRASGERIAIPLVTSGRYFMDELIFEAGERLEIQIIDEENQLHLASAIVPHAIRIDELEAMERNFGRNSDTQKFQVFTHWLDVAEKESFYRIKTFRNTDFLANSYTVVDDLNMEGERLSRPSFTTFEAGDSIQIQLLSINEEMYTYFLDLANIQGEGPGSTTPYNPKGNFDNALGYFGVQQFDTQLIILE